MFCAIILRDFLIFRGFFRLAIALEAAHQQDECDETQNSEESQSSRFMICPKSNGVAQEITNLIAHIGHVDTFLWLKYRTGTVNIVGISNKVALKRISAVVFGLGGFHRCGLDDLFRVDYEQRNHENNSKSKKI